MLSRRTRSIDTERRHLSGSAARVIDERGPQLRRAVVHRRDRQVEQRRRDQDRASKLGAERIGARTSNASASAGRPRPISAARAPASSGSRRRLNDSALASVAMGYQVGVTPLQMAAAVSAVANGGELVQPRVVRAVIRDGRAPAGDRARSSRRVVSPDTPAKLTAIMEAVVERRHRPSSRSCPATRRRQNRHRAKTRQRPLLETRLQRLVRRLRAVAQAGVHVIVVSTRRASALIRRRGRRADLQAHRRGRAAPGGRGAEHRPAAAGDGRPPRRAARNADVGPGCAAGDRNVAGAADGTVFPDLRGLSAREALQALARLG